MTEKTDKSKPPDFDTTAELWDRIVDDVIENGKTCVETVEKLVADSCRGQAGPEAKPDSED